MIVILEQAVNSHAEFDKQQTKKAVKALQIELAHLQRPLREAKIPVILLFEGWSASGKGSMMTKLISELDPRDYQVYSTTRITEEDSRHPLLWPFWKMLPEKGEMALLDRSWHSRVMTQILHGSREREELVQSINTFERQLCDDGYLVLKFFLHISQEEQKRRLEDLAGDETTAWRVTERDWQHNRAYPQRAEAQDQLLMETHTEHAPWHIVWNEAKGAGTLQVLSTMRDAIVSALEQGVPRPKPTSPKVFPLLPTPKLSTVDLSPTVTDGEYKEALKREKRKLQKLHSLLYREKVPVVLSFEGWDAAGKGGAIRRLSWALDPRVFDVIPVAAPTPEAFNRHYLWRFWKTLPKDGHVALYDRTWYGRVMVERLEGFASETRWRQAFDEINEFERELADWGAIQLKFWIHIDKEEQLNRFTARQNTPEKQHKITEEDWRNRDKWEDYEIAVDQMLERTSTEYAPWIIVEGNDKKFARLKVLRTVRKALEARLER